MHRHFRILALAATAFLLSCANEGPHLKPQAGAPLYSCYRHIYNDSNCPWTFAEDPSWPDQWGNIYFGDGSRPNCTQLNGPCTLPAHTTIDIQYTTRNSISYGKWKITDQGGTSKTFMYDTETMGQCPYIKHSGGTGSVSVNDPADGDLHAHGPCTW